MRVPADTTQAKAASEGPGTASRSSVAPIPSSAPSSARPAARGPGYFQRATPPPLLELSAADQTPEAELEQQADRAAELLFATPAPPSPPPGDAEGAAGSRTLPPTMAPPAAGSARIQRAVDGDVGVDVGGGGQPAQPVLLVGEAEIPSAHQRSHLDFLDRVEPVLRSVADAELAAVGRSTDRCPYLVGVLALARRQPAARLEQLARLFASGPVGTAAELEEAVVERVRVATRHWIETGELPELPEDFRSLAESPPSGEQPGGDSVQLAAEPGAAAGRRPSADSVRAQLSTGRPLDVGVRARMELGFGASFADVRVHDGATAHGLSRRIGARAFTVGDDVAFARGQYRPTTLPGQVLLAHELAHTLQQRGGSSAHPLRQADRQLEVDADDATRDAMARVEGLDAAAPQLQSTGLRLQACIGGELDDWEAVGELEPDLRAGTRQFDAPHLIPADQVAPPTTAEATDDPLFATSDDAGWARATDDRMLAVQAGDRLFLLPANDWVSERTEPIATPASATDPSRRPALGAPAVGHGSVQLLNVGGGIGILIDAGGGGGVTRAVLPRALGALRETLGISRIDGVLLVHTHADHVRHLVRLVETGQIQGNRVWVWPGWEQATAGPWAQVLSRLREPGMTARGFGPSWSPTPITVTVPAGTGLTFGSLQVGQSTLSMVTRTQDLSAYVAELQSGSTGTRTADASSMLTRIRPTGGGPDVLVVGDMRGRTIDDIITRMNATGTTFSSWVSNVRTVTGFHHLGNIETGADTAGYRSLLRALPTGEPVTIVGQARASGVNAEFVSRLTAAGFRVVVLPESDPTNLRRFTVGASGSIRSQGAIVHEGRGPAAEANTRIARLRGAAAVMLHPELVEPIFVAGTQRAARRQAASLETEARTLETAVRDRRALELEGVHRGTRPSDYSTRVTQSDTDLRRVGPVEQSFGEETLQQLSRLRPHVGELSTLMREASQRGQPSPRLRQLLAEVGPTVYRDVLARYRIRELPPSMARSRAIRASLAQLLRQRDLQRALQTGGRAPSAAGRGLAGVLAVVELANAILPLIAQARDARRASEAQQLMMAVGVIAWWQRLGINIPFEFYAGDSLLSPADLGAALVRRLWEATPPGDRIPESELEESVRSARALDKVVIPPPTEWPVAHWALFVERLHTIVPTWNEYFHWFRDDPSAAVRYGGSSGDWETLTGTVEIGGTSSLTWTTHASLDTAMDERIAQVRQNTDDWLQAEAAPPSPATPGVASIGRAYQDVPTQTATFASDAARTAYGPYEQRVVTGFQWNSAPSFLVYPAAAAPSGKVWVTGADQATYYVIRGMRIYSYDEAAVVRIHKPTLHDRTYGDAAGLMPTWIDWAISHGSDDEQLAAQLARNQAPGVEWVPYPSTHRDHGSYYGEVRFPADGPNPSGMIMLDEGDLDPGSP